MTTRKCILMDETLSKDNDSKAHIIPSALGGNIKPKGILSASANTILNDKFDSPLIKSLSPFMALLGAIPDRGEVQPDRAGRFSQADSQRTARQGRLAKSHAGVSTRARKGSFRPDRT